MQQPVDRFSEPVDRFPLNTRQKNCFDTRHENAHNFLLRYRIDIKIVALETRLKGLSLQWLHDRFWNFYLVQKVPENRLFETLLVLNQFFMKLQNFITFCSELEIK